jgi:hypothetical protein
MEPKIRFQGMNSASLCSLAGRYDNPIPTRCLGLAPIDFLKIPALAVGGVSAFAGVPAEDSLTAMVVVCLHHTWIFSASIHVYTVLCVERLYCKRPILRLASSKILTPHPLTARRVCPPPAFGAGGGHTRWVEWGWGVNILEDSRH